MCTRDSWIINTFYLKWQWGKKVPLYITLEPEFKNPFDLDEEEDDETIPIHQQYGQVHQAQLHKPLPFNPYTMQDNPGQPV